MSSVSRPRRWRRFVSILGTLVVLFALTVGGAVTWVFAHAKVSTVGRTEFRNELAVPPLATGHVRADGIREFQLDMRSGRTEFRAGQATETWGFNGTYLGPTLRARRGEHVAVTVRNHLPEASTVHWHGMHLPAAMDGGPHQMVQAGATWQPQWRIEQPAATLWYHPHPHGATEDHVRRGLAGLFLLDDEISETLPLPKNYGVDDLPVIVQDVKFRGNELDSSHAIFRDVGFLGDQTMVNGTLTPYRTVGDELIRLRLLNASTARTYTFGFADERAFALVATDGGCSNGRSCWTACRSRRVSEPRSSCGCARVNEPSCAATNSTPGSTSGPSASRAATTPSTSWNSAPPTPCARRPNCPRHWRNRRLRTVPIRPSNVASS
ncbi:multicopper oxidase family protein [Nocardia brasiliensis]|uniref:multicopper oxidase family protein n=1 Tax=Nocardia brasiliensis TaxID=37326 RepID=UPI0024572608|nr:multicopper oxidase domain-containing protein [Nocardia brasiliensis]